LGHHTQWLKPQNKIEKKKGGVEPDFSVTNLNLNISHCIHKKIINLYIQEAKQIQSHSNRIISKQNQQSKASRILPNNSNNKYKNIFTVNIIADK
jgi:uncharacterized protein YueI